MSVGYSQENPSYWNLHNNHELTLNYNMLGRNTVQGAFYGSAGYGFGMWLSGNNTAWGIVGSVLTANIPLLIDGRYKQPEALIGRNLGALSVSLGATFVIRMNRKGRATWNVLPIIRRR